MRSESPLRGAELDAHIQRVHAVNYGVYGAHKMWHQLQREGHRVARCTIERRMRVLDLRGARRGRKMRATIANPGHGIAAAHGDHHVAGLDGLGRADLGRLGGGVDADVCVASMRPG